MKVKRLTKVYPPSRFRTDTDRLHGLGKRQMKVIFLLSLFDYMVREELYAWLSSRTNHRRRTAVASFIWRMTKPPHPIITAKNIAVKGKVKRIFELNKENHIILALGQSMVTEYAALATRVKNKRWRVIKYIDPVKNADTEKEKDAKEKRWSYKGRKVRPTLKRKANRSKRGTKWVDPHAIIEIIQKGEERL